MDAGSSKLLESATQRTLHAHCFTRSSTQASHVLTDLLSRYLSLLTTTCVQYAQHAGRSGITIHDALVALEELGVSVDELGDYCEVEGKELVRYANSTARRAEELAEIKASLSDGLRKDRDDGVALVFAPVPSPIISISDDEDAEEAEWSADEMDFEVGTKMAEAVDDMMGLRPPSTPPLPLSPVSNPSSPARKRARISSWRPPDHVPEFLPPYPSSSAPPSPLLSRSSEQALPHVVKVERAPTPPPQLSASASTSDYLLPVPYSMSSLSSTPEWHLPKPPSPPPSPPPPSQVQQARNSTPLTHQTLITAYHHVLTHPPPPDPPSNPARHKIAMSLLAQNYINPRWSPPDTLFSSTTPAPPRIVAPSPSFPVPLKDVSLIPQDPKAEKGKDKKPPLLPPPMPKPVAFNENITPFSSQPTSRIPDIARRVLPPAVYNRTTKLLPPQPLISGSKEPLIYGQGISAPWNANETQSSAILNKVNSTKDMLNGKSKEKNADSKDDSLADARLFATWDWEAKDFRMPLMPGKRGRIAGAAAVLSARPSIMMGSPSVFGLGRQKGERADGKNGLG